MRTKFISTVAILLVFLPIIICCVFSVPGTYDDVNRWAITANFNSISDYFQSIGNWIEEENGRIIAAAFSLIPATYNKWHYGITNLLIFSFFTFSHYRLLSKIQTQKNNWLTMVFIATLFFLYSVNSKELVSLFFNLSRTTVYTLSFSFLLLFFGMEWQSRSSRSTVNLNTTLWSSFYIVLSMLSCEAAIVPIGLFFLYKFFCVRKSLKVLHFFPVIIYFICCCWILWSGSNNNRILKFFNHGNIHFSIINSFSYLSLRFNEIYFNGLNIVLILSCCFMFKKIGAEFLKEFNVYHFIIFAFINLFGLSFVFIYSKGWAIQERFDNYLILFGILITIISLAHFFEKFNLNFEIRHYAMALLLGVVICGNSPFGKMYLQLFNGEITTCFREVYKMDEYLKTCKNEKCVVPTFTYQPTTTFLNLIFGKNSGNNKRLAKVHNNLSIALFKNRNFTEHEAFLQSLNDKIKLDSSNYFYCKDDNIVLEINEFDQDIFKHDVQLHLHYNNKMFWKDINIDPVSNVENGSLLIFVNFPCDILNKIEIHTGDKSIDRKLKDLIYSFEISN